MAQLRVSEGIKRGNIPNRNNWMVQVGWLGESGNVYSLKEPPTTKEEPGSFEPLYVEVGD